ncbi:ABC transporter substrate-binding protein [Novosphingobium colocasiae]
MSKVRGYGFTRRAAVVALMASVALAGCGKSNDAAKPAATAGAVEKPNLKLGFIKLTDIAPLVVAKEKGFFSRTKA